MLTDLGSVTLVPQSPCTCSELRSDRVRTLSSRRTGPYYQKNVRTVNLLMSNLIVRHVSSTRRNRRFPNRWSLKDVTLVTFVRSTVTARNILFRTPRSGVFCQSPSCPPEPGCRIPGERLDVPFVPFFNPAPWDRVGVSTGSWWIDDFS